MDMEIKYMEKYKEIWELKRYCEKIGVDCTIERLYDGYAIRFKKINGDFVQHYGSYGSGCGCVEPAIGCRLDYRAVTLKQAKGLVRRRRLKL